MHEKNAVKSEKNQIKLGFVIAALGTTSWNLGLNRLLTVKGMVQTTGIGLYSKYSKFHINLPLSLSLSPYPGPHFVAVNNKNEIIVTDFHNHSVKVKA